MECSSELFRQEVESADDIRLNAPLVSKCMGAKKDFCNDIEPGVLISHGESGPINPLSAAVCLP